MLHHLEAHYGVVGPALCLQLLHPADPIVDGQTLAGSLPFSCQGRIPNGCGRRPLWLRVPTSLAAEQGSGARLARPRMRRDPRALKRVVMSFLVMKFGGTSVANLERIRNVARHVKREIDAGNQVAVVVSAMAGVTNQLVAWVREASPLHDAREYE